MIAPIEPNNHEQELFEQRAPAILEQHFTDVSLLLKLKSNKTFLMAESPGMEPAIGEVAEEQAKKIIDEYSKTKLQATHPSRLFSHSQTTKPEEPAQEQEIKQTPKRPGGSSSS